MIVDHNKNKANHRVNTNKKGRIKSDLLNAISNYTYGSGTGLSAWLRK